MIYSFKSLYTVFFIPQLNFKHFSFFFDFQNFCHCIMHYTKSNSQTPGKHALVCEITAWWSLHALNASFYVNSTQDSHLRGANLN